MHVIKRGNCKRFFLRNAQVIVIIKIWLFAITTKKNKQMADRKPCSLTKSRRE
jgi:hypothetical protein